MIGMAVRNNSRKLVARNLGAQRSSVVPFILPRKRLLGAKYAAFVEFGKPGFDVIKAYKKAGLSRTMAVQVEVDRLKAMKQSARGDPRFLTLNLSGSAIRELAKQNIAREYGKA